MDATSYNPLPYIQGRLSEYSTTEIILIVSIAIIVVIILIFIFTDKGAKNTYASLGPPEHFANPGPAGANPAANPATGPAGANPAARPATGPAGPVGANPAARPVTGPAGPAGANPAARPVAGPAGANRTPLIKNTGYGPALQSIDDLTVSAFNILLLVYDEGCPHCKSFKTTWANLAADKTLTKSVHFFSAGGGSVEAAQSLRRQVESTYHVSGYPTILFKKAGTTTFVEYKGPRDAAAIRAYIKSSI